MSLITPYQPLSIAFERGEGVWLWDTSGKKYLDALSGIAVCSLGHAHPAVTKTISEQAGKLIHTSNTFQIKHQIELAEKLCALTGMEQAFFANSGAEANETAIKLSRIYGHKKNIETPQIIVMENGFHGRTMGTLSASGNPKFRDGYEPLLPGYIRVPYDDIPAIKKVAKTHQDIVAILVEPIQGEGGVHIPHENYLVECRKLCDQHGWLLMLDEVQTGVGRTGFLYAYQAKNIMPDVLASAKALANGVPIGACLMRGPAVDLFKVGTHGSTFGGNPLSCATALTVLDVIEKTDLCAHVRKVGDYLMNRLKEALSSKPQVRDIRGQGLIIGIELDQPCRPIMQTALKHGLLINVTADKVIRLIPPLIITQQEIDLLIERLMSTLDEYLKV